MSTEQLQRPAVPPMRELLAVREISRALLVSERASDVYQFALDRVTPILGGTFSLVMQLNADGALLRPVAQHQWPTPQRAWIGALRVRVGDGPSGLAVAESRLVEVADVLADDGLAEWHEIARELGFRSIIAAPLLGAKGPLGAVAFYFADATQISEEQRDLVRVVADQLAATAEKAAVLDELRRVNAALAVANESLQHQATAASLQLLRRDRLLTSLTAELEAGFAGVRAHEGWDADDALRAARAVTTAAREQAAVWLGTLDVTPSDVDARDALHAAVRLWRDRVRTVPMHVGEPTVLLPTVHTDPRWLARALELLVGHAIDGSRADGSVQADIALGRGFVEYRIAWNASAGDGSGDAGMPRGARHPEITPLGLALASSLAERLGGNVRLPDPDGDGQERALSLVIPVEVA